MSNMITKTLKEKAENLNSTIEFMDEREKGNTADLVDQTVTIKDFDFLDGNNGEYVAFIIDEDPKCFYFGGTVLTEDLKEFDQEGYKETIQSEGLPVLMTKRMSKNNRQYVAVTYYPEG